MDRFEWLLACCDGEHPRIDSPFAVVLNGEAWTVATDAVISLMVPGFHAPARADGIPPCVVAQFMAPPEDHARRRTTVAALRAWAEREPGGAPYANREEQSPIANGVMIDRDKLATLLSGAPDGAIEVATGAWNDPVLLRGDGWRGAIMPMRHVVGPMFDGWES